jgi:hypothetical protein
MSVDPRERPWTLVLQLPADAATVACTVERAGVRLHCRCGDGEDWAILRARCVRCGEDSLRVEDGTSALTRCEGCGAGGVLSTQVLEAVATLRVDDELYGLLDWDE